MQQQQQHHHQQHHHQQPPPRPPGGLPTRATQPSQPSRAPAPTKSKRRRRGGEKLVEESRSSSRRRRRRRMRRRRRSRTRACPIARGHENTNKQLLLLPSIYFLSNHGVENSEPSRKSLSVARLSKYILQTLPVTTGQPLVRTRDVLLPCIPKGDSSSRSRRGIAQMARST